MSEVQTSAFNTQTEDTECQMSNTYLCCQCTDGCILHISEQVFHSYRKNTNKSLKKRTLPLMALITSDETQATDIQPSKLVHKSY